MDFDANGIPQNHRYLFTNYVDLTLDDILKLASITWDNGLNIDCTFNHTIDEIGDDSNIMQLRICSVMLAKDIKKLLTIPAKKKLMLQKRKYQHLVFTESTMEEDGPTMSYLILNEVQPESTIGIDGLKDKLRSINLANFSHNIEDMLNHIQSLYEKI